MKPKRSTAPPHWLNGTVLGIGLASLFSDWSHEIATTVMPAFLATMGVAAAWLGLPLVRKQYQTLFAPINASGTRRFTAAGRFVTPRTWRKRNPTNPPGTLRESPLL